MVAVADQHEQVKARLLERRLWCPSTTDGVLGRGRSLSRRAAGAGTSAGRDAGRAGDARTGPDPPCSVVWTWSMSSARHSTLGRPAWVTSVSTAPSLPSSRGSKYSWPLQRRFRALSSYCRGAGQTATTIHGWLRAEGWLAIWRTGTTPVSARSPLAEARVPTPSKSSGVAAAVVRRFGPVRSHRQRISALTGTMMLTPASPASVMITITDLSSRSSRFSPLT